MKTKRRWAAASLASIGMLASAAASAQMLTAPCLNPSAALVVEEARLPNTLPDNGNPAVLQPKPYAQQMIEGAGFEDFGPAFAQQLCATGNLKGAQHFVENSGEELWKRAVARAQQLTEIKGNLPFSDD